MSLFILAGAVPLAVAAFGVAQQKSKQKNVKEFATLKDLYWDYYDYYSYQLISEAENLDKLHTIDVNGNNNIYSGYLYDFKNAFYLQYPLEVLEKKFADFKKCDQFKNFKLLNDTFAQLKSVIYNSPDFVKIKSLYETISTTNWLGIKNLFIPIGAPLHN
jgi:hypothetical protein